MTVIPSDADLVLYFEGKKTSPVYEAAKQKYYEIKIHANGDGPGELLTTRRPHESDELQAYREKIFEPVTKVTFNSILQSLGKIRRSRDWTIKYDRDAKFPLIPDDETLQKYCEDNFPYYDSVTTWLFSVMLKSMLTDANCALLVLPLNPDADDTTYKKPYPIVFYSDQIIDFLPDRYAIFKSPDQVDVPDGKGGTAVSDKFFLITTQEMIPYVKIQDHWVAVEEEIIKHGLGYLPIIRPRCIFDKTVKEYNLFDSFVYPVIPYLNETLREYSDLQAAVVSHLFPERWEIATQECNTCGGSGMIPNPNFTGTDGKSKQIVCAACNGLGAKSSGGPYIRTVIRLPKTNLGEQAVPVPPFDYVKKDIEVIKVMQERIEKHKFDALSSINMQFLAQVPLSVSGDAKEVDRDELNNFVYNIAEAIVYIADNLYGMIADYRYAYQYPNPNERSKMLPNIPVPERFDLMSQGGSLDDIVKMKNNNIGGTAMTTFLKDFIKKEYYNEPLIALPALLELELDPFAGLSEADKSLNIMAGNYLKIDIAKSCYIKTFVQRALAEFDDFGNWDYLQQVAQIEQYAQEMLDQQKEENIPPNPRTPPATPAKPEPTPEPAV